jgi:two-component system, cell cycle sensor histidine kinase and response regulator CckA
MYETDHVGRMIEVVMKTARGDYSGRIDSPGRNDDLDTLADAINKMVVDVRERTAEFRGMENAFREVTGKYQRFQSNIPGMVYLCIAHPDGNYSFPYVNAASRQLFGLEPEALMRDGTLLWGLIHPDDQVKHGRSLRRSAATLQPLREELRFIINGEVRWYECIARPELQINGDILWDGIMLEITERKRAEEALRESEAKYRRLHETMTDAFVRIDMIGNIQEANRAYQALLGYTEEELLQRTYGDLTPEKWHTLEAGVIADQVLVNGHSQVYEKEYRRKDGTIFPVELRTFLLRDDAGEPIGMWAIVRDITERKHAEEERAKLESQLIQAQKMESVGRLAGGVAHDFNNMLSVILGYAELIKAKLPDGDPFLKDILAIEKAASHSRDITRQLLAFSRKQIIAPRIINLNELITSSRNTLSRLIGEDIDLRFFPGGNLWRINFDPAQVEQILVNLAVNARDAMPDGGKLTIETTNSVLDESYCLKHLGFKPGKYVFLGVSDDGTGMDREIQSHLFEPFFTTKEVGKGTGLGLATVYGMVKQNGGFINCYSEPGRGTTFKIYIPRVGEEDEIAEEPKEPPVAYGAGRILLVEDDEMVREITKDILEEIGYTVLAANNPQEAVALCENRDTAIDLLLTDVVMPEMSGKELGNRIAAIRPGIKVLFMSGYTSNVIAHRGVLEKGVHFIQKPFRIKDLARKIHELIGER